MESINCDRRGGVATGEGPPTAARLFAHALLGGPLPNDLRASAEAHTNREHSHWLTCISTRHAAPAKSEFSEQGDANLEHAELEWLAAISSRHERQLRSVQSRQSEANQAQTDLQSLVERLRIEEAQWDPAKHPRRGAPPNAGWFATTGGGGAAGPSGRSPSLLDRLRQRNSDVAELTGVVTPGMIRANLLTADVESAATLNRDVAIAWAKGLGTGEKAVANGFVTAIKDVATLGLSPGQIEMLGVTQEDRDRGYDTAVKFSTASGQILIAVGTLGIGTALSGGGSVVRVASGALVVFDTAGNAVGAVQGVYDVSQNGLTLANGTQIAGSAFGLGANAKSVKGFQPAGKAKDAVPDGLAAKKNVVPDELAAKVDEFVETLPKSPTPTRTPASRYEVKHTGPYNYRVSGGGATFDIDGFRGTTILEAKHVEKPLSSPFVPGSSCWEPLRRKILNDVRDELRRARSIIESRSTPFTSIEMITNHPEAKRLFEELLREAKVPGNVRLEQ